MQNGPVADRNVGAHNHRKARVGMNDAPILNVAAGADVDAVAVGAKDCGIPDAGSVVQVNISDESYPGC